MQGKSSRKRMLFERVPCTRSNGEAVCRGIPGARKVLHSPTGYEWGYGSDPADLALNILAAVLPGEMGERVQLRDRRQSVSRDALALYQAFKYEVIARMPAWGFELTRGDVDRWLAARQADEWRSNDVGHELMHREYDRPLREAADS